MSHSFLSSRNVHLHSPNTARSLQLAAQSITQSSYLIGQRRQGAMCRKRSISLRERMRTNPAGRGRQTVPVNSRLKKLDEWPPHVLQLDVGGRTFCVRLESLAMHPTTRLGRIHYLLHRLSFSRRNGNGILQAASEQLEEEGADDSRRSSEHMPLGSGLTNSLTAQHKTKPKRNTGTSVLSLKPQAEPEGKELLDLSITNSSSSKQCEQPFSEGASSNLDPGSSSGLVPDVTVEASDRVSGQTSTATCVENSALQSLEEEDFEHEKEITRLCDVCDLDTGYFYFDRDPISFITVANFYRTKALHMPAGVCFRAFQDELVYWGIHPEQLEPCCLNKFRGSLTQDTEDSSCIDEDGQRHEEEEDKRYFGLGCCEKFREKLWRIFEYPHTSTAAKVVTPEIAK